MNLMIAVFLIIAIESGWDIGCRDGQYDGSFPGP
jgi:hypothetical protein